jgi:hypothetical protein
MGKLTTKMFIKRSSEKHNNFYDYSKSSYINSKTQVIITCPIHDDFSQIASNHWNGQGCPKCGKIKLIEKNTNTQEQFIEKVNKVHNYTYDYTKTNYIHNGDKITITCKIHGDFEQKAYVHTAGNGCQKCGRLATANSHRYDTGTFIEKSNEKHNFLYNYSKVNYINSEEKVIIECSIHGDFKQRPADHLSGIGCRKCAFIKVAGYKKLTTQSFIEKSNKVHNNIYSYNKTNYKDAFTKVTITCPIHGDFNKIASAHIYGGGCQKCGFIKGGFGFSRSEFIKKAKERVCTFYTLRCFNEKEEFYKIGITMNSTQERYYGMTKMPYKYEVLSEVKGSARFIWDLEVEEKKKLREFNYQPLLKFGGAQTECFKQYKKYINDAN